jgi:hypothetical protein
MHFSSRFSFSISRTETGSHSAPFFPKKNSTNNLHCKKFYWGSIQKRSDSPHPTPTHRHTRLLLIKPVSRIFFWQNRKSCCSTYHRLLLLCTPFYCLLQPALYLPPRGSRSVLSYNISNSYFHFNMSVAVRKSLTVYTSVYLSSFISCARKT